MLPPRSPLVRSNWPEHQIKDRQSALHARRHHRRNSANGSSVTVPNPLSSDLASQQKRSILKSASFPFDFSFDSSSTSQQPRDLIQPRADLTFTLNDPPLLTTTSRTAPQWLPPADDAIGAGPDSLFAANFGIALDLQTIRRRFG
ncbi:hypothetical protein LIA77_00479 [Sarocladium implicatum]|nr:hypothetical protein LIA77_00479 [Sarocladium implicatum]